MYWAFTGRERLGMEPVTVPAHWEALRLPVSWDAVASFKVSVEERARLKWPVEAGAKSFAQS